MKLEAKAVFTITIRHEFFIQNYCPDVEIEPTPLTKKLLDGYHMLVKKGPITGIYTMCDEAVFKNEKFVFYLKLKNHAFNVYTDLALKHSNEVLYFTANEAIEPIDEKSYTPLSGRVMKLSGPAYSYLFSPGRKTISLIASNGKAEETIEYGKDALVDRHIFRPLKNESLYNIEITSDTGYAKEQVFVDFNLKHDSVITGLIVVEAKDLTGKLPENFLISFRQKSSYWQYVIAVKKQSSDVRIEDKGFEFEKREKLNFIPVNLPSDEKKTYATLLSIPENNLYVFVSTAGIPSSEKSKSGITLIKDGFDVKQLPNPLQEALVLARDDKNISMIYVTI